MKIIFIASRWKYSTNNFFIGWRKDRNSIYHRDAQLFYLKKYYILCTHNTIFEQEVLPDISQYVNLVQSKIGKTA